MIDFHFFFMGKLLKIRFLINTKVLEKAHLPRCCRCYIATLHIWRKWCNNFVKKNHTIFNTFFGTTTIMYHVRALLGANNSI